MSIGALPSRSWSFRWLRWRCSSALRRYSGVMVTPRDGPVVVLPLALGLSILMLLLAVPGNQLSRQIELTADYDAIELTGDPAAMIRLQRRIAENNLSDPDPPAAWQALFGTHPPALDLIGLALAIEEKELIETDDHCSGKDPVTLRRR